MKSAEKRRLMEEHYLDFFSYAMAMLRNSDDAKDAVQEAIVKVLTTRNVDDVMRYTYRTLRNEAVNIMRQHRRFARLNDNIPDAESSHEASLRAVAELRDELPEALKSLVELHDEEDYTVAELAVLTGLSTATLRRRLAEAHELLKKRIEEEI